MQTHLPTLEATVIPGNTERIARARGTNPDPIRRDDLGMRPLVEIVEAEDERQIHKRQHRQHARRGAEDAARDNAPGAARELVDHAERQTAQRDAEHARLLGLRQRALTKSS